MFQNFHPSRLLSQFTEIFGLGRAAGAAALSVITVAALSAAYLFFHSAPPATLTLTSGPPGSSFELNAEKYAKALAKEGVKLNILPSHGSEENLLRLSNPKSKVNVGFVQGGVTNLAGNRKLLSLGSISYEPLMVFVRASNSAVLLSDFAGKRLAIGPEGSGTRTLALTLLSANGIEPGGPTTLLDVDAEAAVKALQAGSVDAAFLMSDSVATQTIRQLIRDPAYKLFDFVQAAGYTRRIFYLNKFEIPEGSIDFGKNLPPRDVHLIGPTVELIAIADLHPALSDLLLEAAREVHGNASLLQQRGEFPAPAEHGFPISPDALRYYKSGKSFLYRRLPFWLAGLVERVVVLILPMALVLVPGLKLIPAIFRWRVKLLLFRWYRALLAVEKGLLVNITPEKRKELVHRLDHIDSTVARMKVPASFADQFYSLRGHIDFVREKLQKPA
jgi:hypothetical protein